MSKRKFGVDRDDSIGISVSSTIGARLAALQDELPTLLKFLAPLLENIQQAYEIASPPHKTPTKVRN